MSQEQNTQGGQDEEQQGGGSPMWMVTYGDAITLLLTFFLMLLTFSTPNEEQYQMFARGVMSGSRRLGLGNQNPNLNSMVAQEQRMAESRLAPDGAESRSADEEASLDDLRYYHKSMDVSQLRELSGAYVIRVPLSEMFGLDETLRPSGRAALYCVVKMTHARSYSIVVRAKAAPSGKADRSVALALKAAGYIRRRASSTCQDIGVSNDECELSSPPLTEGQCEIIMLEV